MLGSSDIKPTKNEMKSKKEFQRVLVAANNIKKEHIFKEILQKAKQIIPGDMRVILLPGFPVPI